MEEIKFDIPKGYEFAGVDDDKQQVVFHKIQSQYPKTYEECCKILGIPSNLQLRNQTIEAWYIVLLKFFQELLICRDAYWKIADWKFNYDEKCYYLFTELDNIKKYEGICDYNAILAFPTEEMRNAFYENFKELIGSCKEFL